MATNVDLRALVARALQGGQLGVNDYVGRKADARREAPNLMLTIQRLIDDRQQQEFANTFRQQEADKDEKFRRDSLEMQHSEATANRMEEAGRYYHEQLQRGFDNRMKIQAQKDLRDHRDALAKKAEADALAQKKDLLQQERLSLNTLKKSLEELPESYDELSKEQFEDMFQKGVNANKRLEELAQIQGYTQSLGDDGEPFSFRKMKSGQKAFLDNINKRLSEIGVELGEAPIIPTPVDFQGMFGAPQKAGSPIPPPPESEEDYRAWMNEAMQ